MGSSAFDAVVGLVLYACFALYIAVGMGFVIMGLIYINEVGEAATTALVMLLAGGTMLVVGGVAMFGNFKRGRMGALILFVIEIVNMVLFLVLYIFIVAAVMIALGIDDPVRKGTAETWEFQRVELEGQGYCRTAGPSCDGFYRSIDDLQVATTTCQLTEAEATDATVNCTIFSEYRYEATNIHIGGGADTLAWQQKYGGCGSYTNGCAACDVECMEKAIDTVKEYMAPAAVRHLHSVLCACFPCACDPLMRDRLPQVLVLLLSFYCIAAVVINSWVTSSGTISGVKRLVGLVINGVLTLLSFILLAAGIYAAIQASNNCKSTDGCTSWASIMILVLGAGVLVVGGATTFAMLKDIKVIVRVTNILIVILGLFLLMAGVAMGLASGTLLGDINSEYDNNYPQMRQELEKFDHTYCQLTMHECERVTNGASVPICDGDEDVCTDHDRDALWHQQYAAMQTLLTADAADSAISDTFSICQNPVICIYCKPFLESIFLNNDLEAMSAAGPDYHARYPSINPFSDMNSGCYWTASTEELVVAAGLARVVPSPAAIQSATTKQECAAAATELYSDTVGEDLFDFVSFERLEGGSDSVPEGSGTCTIWTGYEDSDPTTLADYDAEMVLNGVMAHTFSAQATLEIAGGSTCGRQDTSDWQADIANHTRHFESSSDKMAGCRDEVEAFARDESNIGVPVECQHDFYFDNTYTADDSEYAKYQLCVDWLIPFVADQCHADVE
eukprot:SAG31_NODE_4454_length_3218_cov_2.758576_2_plen_732_part_01